MIELARVLARHRTQLKRSVLLMAFSGEELGLLGSAYWVNRPTVPVERVTAMLNMDMIGRLSGDRVFVGGIGTAAEWQKWVEEANGAVSLKLDYSQAGDGSSDHTSFSIRKIPVLFFFSGLHADYHKPSDTVEKINVAGAARVLQLVYLLTDRLANAPARLQYTQPEIPRMPVSGSGDSGYGPYFGSIPDFRDGVQGVPFADVRPGSPAAKAGLRTGDIMIEFDGKPVLTLYDFTYSLRGKKPGDQIVVVVKRGTETVTVNVTLERRQ